MQVVPYLNFDGNCRGAFEFYHQVLGGTLHDFFTFGDVPMEGVPEELNDKIAHAHLQLGDYAIMGTDSPSDWQGPPQSISVSLQFDSIAEIEQVYASLSEQGSVDVPLSEQPWATRFAMFTDRFGIPWLLNCDAPE